MKVAKWLYDRADSKTKTNVRLVLASLALVMPTIIPLVVGSFFFGLGIQNFQNRGLVASLGWVGGLFGWRYLLNPTLRFVDPSLAVSKGHSGKVVRVR